MRVRFWLNAALAAGVASLALTGCAGMGGKTGADVADPTAQVSPYRDAVDLSGHLSVNYLKDGQSQSLSVNFTWLQRPGRIEVSIFTPLGQTVAEIQVTPQSATLTQGDQPPRTAADIDTLSAQTLGFALPVSGLRDWLQGYATDTQGKRFVASPANASVVTRDGWRVRFVTWQDAAAGGAAPGAAPMPRRIDVNRGSAANGDALDIRIVLDAG